MTNTELGKTRHIRCCRKIRNRPPFLSSLCLISMLFYFAESRRARRPLPHLQLPARSAVPCSFFFPKGRGASAQRAADFSTRRVFFRVGLYEMTARFVHSLSLSVA